MPKIKATTSRVPSFDQPLPASSSIPGTAAVATPRAAAETTTRRRNLIVQILLDFSRSDVGTPGRGSTPGRGRPASPKRVTLALLRPSPAGRLLVPRLTGEPQAAWSTDAVESGGRRANRADLAAPGGAAALGVAGGAGPARGG